MAGFHKVFLLGGHDLEMAEIRRILEVSKIQYFDRNLKWETARLSAYADILNNKNEFIGVELDIDITPPINYKSINHHNTYSSNSSSLEQVCELLNIELTREQQLIAANDKGFIPAMEAIGATQYEIDRICALEHIAQGITEEDEQLGERSIKENLTTEKGITVVKSLTPHFRTITEKLYPNSKLLIYNKTELNYYGIGAKKLAYIFKELIDEKSAYSGGSGDGYFGINSKGMAQFGNVKAVKEKIINILTMDTKTYSYHIFMFPFKWDNNLVEGKTFSERFDLTKLKIKDGSCWINLPNPITPEYASELYNEKNFFYDFVHPVLYDNGNLNESVVLHYERKEAYGAGLFYEIDVIASHSSHYKLNIKSIGLNFYSTGTGSLIFYIENQTYPEFEDVLRINQYGRRIFPPYISLPDGIMGTKQTELANYISITGLKGNEHRYFEDFSNYTDKTNWKPARFIESLIDDFSENLEIKPVTDDRMQVLCWYGNDAMSSAIKDDWMQNKKFVDNWYRFLFVDSSSSPMCYNEEMKQRLIKSHTYQRWQQTGSLHGISRYSFVYLTSSTAPNFLVTYFRTMYTRMVELSLIQRASILKFSDEVADLSKLERKMECKSDRLSEDISILYKEYIRFVNQVYFREVTAQEQGIELYSMMQSKMRIADQVKDLDKEIGELHQYAVLLEDRDRNKSLYTLSLLGALFIIPAFITGFFGMNFTAGNGSFIFYFVFSTVILITATVLIHQKIKNKAIKWWLIGLLIALLLTTLLLPLILNKI